MHTEHRKGCRVIDLFCGAGGLTRGFLDAGLEVVAGIDVDPSCRYAYEQNNDVPFFLKDVFQLKPEDLRELFGSAYVRVLAGCAPCQPFSNYRQGRRSMSKKDQRWNLLYEFSRLVEGTLPDIICMENVPQLATKPAFRDFVERLKTAGYRVDWSILDCSFYGVPQQRKRLTLLGSRLGEISIPSSPTESVGTVRKFIEDLPKIEAGECCSEDRLHRSLNLSAKNLLRIRQSVPGGSWKEWDESLVLPCHQRNTGKGYGGVYGRMEWDKPAPTITTQCLFYGSGRFGHPEQDRAISLREAALLQTFPPDYHFFCEKRPLAQRDTARLIGNAVPVRLANTLGDTILRHSLEQRETLR